jgi:hypothetical protein
VFVGADEEISDDDDDLVKDEDLGSEKKDLRTIEGEDSSDALGRGL